MFTPVMEDALKDFFSSGPERPIIVIYGPTACGKTSLAIEVAERHNGEVISADSRQIYKGLNIGTGKVTEEEMCGIKHWMLDIIAPDISFSVVDYRNMVNPLLDDIWQRGKIPILCGGTGLYIDSIIYQRSYPHTPANTIRRKELEEIEKAEGKEALWNILYKLDPAYAKELHPNNHHYVMRAIEVFESTGTSKLSTKDGLNLKYPTLFLTPYSESDFIPKEVIHQTKEERKIRKLKIPLERQTLYHTINGRIDEMFFNGLIEEVTYNMDIYGASCPGLKTIGYSEVVDYIEGKVSLEDCIELVKQHNRNYAKRQLTWNKKYA